MSKSTRQASQSQIRILLSAAKAAPTPPLGPALGQRGVKAIDFCRAFNERTKHFIPDTPIPTSITVKPDRTVSFITKLPPTTWLLKQAAGIEKGAAKPGSEIVGKVSLKHIYEIAKIKKEQVGLERISLRGMCRAVISTANGMGIKVVP
ncbi:8314_t:CDS:1 [Paraglomus brasilianum]|uniref:Large ribosomal subunit protein uL11m n=1 Tax=Paraglomus brasilianum TaxID=144538 RepID=A0A9N8VMU6_9GLOM|nr:8314_t:CDS:1 [Paraglomus brasilianum]